MDTALRKEILAILAEGRDLTLATVRPDGAPQATTVSYAADGLAIYFGCGVESRKARNLALDDRVSLTVDLPYSDWNSIRGLPLYGRAEPVPPDAWPEIGRLFAGKFPEMAHHQGDVGQMALFRVTPLVVSVLDYRKGFGHVDLVTLDPGSRSDAVA
ncbi:MAG: pyridoxamine 5'-phosphate oxidase family protein [Caulobacterales bacterium]|nr:pyridoxamine 5'-phosphate oxidase family protein [Caulobacterales bacterium]